ncbi:ABC-type glycerol-3-phosphate transport system, substrate-binding protein [Evansella caseinilytica]|uniref:ABC-type glycerol-3-phosphate transport system, substrate-binding protein n=1 Tax=Evansella caseinilytica TaxID=1503961 RepID=A0A1H3NUW2_9BACI|nr:extracellular solute-binding protein [Evansella caseinilytica]SDY91959.1 ABC-type glycerol-3-phosphate transport system, substrate-binding protein [Evansella caseinilytica]
MYILRKKYVRVMIVITLLFSSIWFLTSLNSSDKHSSQAMAEFTAVTTDHHDGGYDNYLMQYATADKPDHVIRMDGEDYADTEGEGFQVVDQYNGLVGKAVITPEEGSISWDVPIEHPGLYQIRIHYFPIEGKSSAIQRELKINGEIPFDGADFLLFDRVWDNQEEEFFKDDNGNELRPRQVERPEWLTVPFIDSEGYFNEPYFFYFDEGVQRITLTSKREPMAIAYIELYQQVPAKSYQEILAEYEANGIERTTDQYIKIQAESAVRKSSPTLFPLTDRSSPTVQPYHVSKLRVNTIGGTNWKQPGQWIEWEVEVEEEGLYQIALKRKQDQLRGLYSTRSLTINGEQPFKEMNLIRFHYNLDWQMDVLGDEEGEPYLFHLTEGIHRIRMTVTLGDIAPLLRTIESSVLELNEMYRKILMITSNTPDPLRDYQLERRIPDMLEVFEEQAETIKSVADYLEQSTGERSDKVAVLHSTVAQLEDMVEYPDTIARRLDSYKLNVGGLGTWIQTVREQPLTLDYLIVSSAEQELPSAEATFFERAKHEAGAFFASYTEDYDSIGGSETSDRSITVWLTTGRDQAQILKGLIDDTFTKESGISVSLRLVPANILLPATLADEGPDVALQIGEDVPVNYAMRNASADLTVFPDFNEVATRFRDSAIIPYMFNDGVYALPETQMFPVMFYRTDILEELNLTPPVTWDEVYGMISVLQRQNLEFYLPIDDPTAQSNQLLVPNATYSMLLYQNGGQFYQEDHRASALDSEVAIEAFQQWTQFYTNYKFPLMADFPNRLRVGEMPIGIADYSTYNLLTVLAPEIRGLWEFTTVPGTRMADGTINHSVSSFTTAAMMLEKADDKEASWEFLKWWTDKDTQIAFGREMESLLGEAARYPTANIEALEELPWPIDDYNNLASQWQWVRGIPQVPGGYFTGRHLDNAFRRVVNASENPREALSDYIRYINDEIEIKRKEFNLPY